MRKPTVTIYTNLTTPKQALIKIYTDNNWVNATGWIYYNNKWYYIDQPNTEYEYLLDNNNNYILDSEGRYILVKRG